MCRYFFYYLYVLTYVKGQRVMKKQGIEPNGGKLWETLFLSLSLNLHISWFMKFMDFMFWP